MEKYPVPQFIEEEGKIVYFLTFKQFFWILGGGAACLVLYFTLPFWIFLILAAIIALSIGSVAFIKVQGDSLLKILYNFLSFSARVKKYSWKKKTGIAPFRVKKHEEFEDFSGEPALKTQAGKLRETKKNIELTNKM